ncbi:MAG: phospholipid/cholesterol/gamma-HCH transport system substrate-binding protein [Actinomycetota bacterium]|jgi:virulence factor Mce-like protein|nr:phospholipid/cholesterol/gamma-HCH transport system substrate-binding protein [Actinomycetota bacterium]
MLMKAGKRGGLGQAVLLRVYGVVFLVVLALLVGLTVAIYKQTFVPVVHVTLQTDRVGNQLAPPADVKLRGMIVGEVRSVSSNGRFASVDLALKPGSVDLIPSNVRARLLPKTLFGEKFVDLVIPPNPSPQPLSAGDVIPQDHSRTAIELERVLDNIMPLLRAVKPAQLNETLDAFATALEGRGNQIGQNLELVNQYFGRLNPHLPAIETDIRRLARVSQIYGDAAPDLVTMLRNFSVNTRTIAEKSRVYAGFLAGTAGFANTTRSLLQEDGDRIIRLNAVSRPILAVLARYSPEYPCVLKSLTQSNKFIGDAFAGGALHITLEVVRSQQPYHPGDEPAWGDNTGPTCRGIPNPPVPAPKARLQDGTQGGPSGSAVPDFVLDPDSGLAGTAQERSVVNPLAAPVMGRPVARVPDLAALLFGPIARGTEVGLS